MADWRKEFDKKSIEFKREMVRKVLLKCTSEQQTFFNRMYKSIDDIPEEKMRWAYQQCKATAKKTTSAKGEGVKRTKYIKGWLRLWVWSCCPECNSDAPELYACPICKYYNYVPKYKVTKSQKKIAWERFIQALKEGGDEHNGE